MARNNEPSRNTDKNGQSTSTAISSDSEKENFHRFMYSIGKTIPVNSSASYLIHQSAHIRVYKNVFVGVDYEGGIDRMLNHGMTTDTIIGISADLSITIFSNPIYRKGKSAVGVWAI